MCLDPLSRYLECLFGNIQFIVWMCMYNANTDIRYFEPKVKTHTHIHSISLSRYLCRYPNWLPCDIKRMSDTYKNVYTHRDSTTQYVCCLNVSVDFTWFLHKYLHAILSFVKFNNHYCFFGHFVCWFFPSILIYLDPIPCGRNTQSFFLQSV